MEPQVVKRMVDHMNEDHADAVRLYVLAFSELNNVDTAVLTCIDEQGMDIACKVNSDDLQVRIDFDPPVTASDQVRSRLVEMVGKAREKLAG